MIMTIPTGNIPEARHLIIMDLIVGPNGVRYRRVPLYWTVVLSIARNGCYSSYIETPC